jgi:pSer/pThr/pTyr-binding forkhead associated (FHA) protein
MNIRMQVGFRDGRKRLFQHAGPIIHIGREPGFELLLDADKVSRKHARIDLAARGATLTDMASSNGTLLNDRLLSPNAPSPLKVGDRIQLGQTGVTTLTVLELDLTEVPRGAPLWVRARRWPQALGAGTVGMLRGLAGKLRRR